MNGDGKLEVSMNFGDVYVSKSIDLTDLDTNDVLNIIESMVEFLEIGELEEIN